MDRFKEIQKRTYFGKKPVVGDDAHWLVQEIVRLRKENASHRKTGEALLKDNIRLRKIEDECLKITLRSSYAYDPQIDVMLEVLRANPRPEPDDAQ